MEIAVMASLFAKRDVDVNTCHVAKVLKLRGDLNYSF